MGLWARCESHRERRGRQGCGGEEGGGGGGGFRGGRNRDVGCGTQKFPGAIGIDVRPHPSADIRHDLNAVPWPFEDGSFDLVVMRHVLEHLKDVVEIIDELYRITRPGGRIVVEVPHFTWAEAYRHPRA